MSVPRSQQRRWVVREGDGGTVGAIVVRAGEGAHAVAEGRVFVGRLRVTDASRRVNVGDEVNIGRAPAGGARVQAKADVIWERDGLLACNKPAGIPTVADHVGASHALVALAADWAGCAVSDVRVTSRLDRAVSGVVVFATTALAESRLRRAREQGLYGRRYIALAPEMLLEPGASEATRGSSGVWNTPIGEGPDPLHRAANGANAKPARTSWARVARAGGFAMLAVGPHTGRTHQIRVHASHAGTPLFGDRDYGGVTRITLETGRVLSLTRIALHAAQVTVPGHDGGSLVAAAPIPLELQQVWSSLGGAPEAWALALTRELDP